MIRRWALPGVAGVVLAVTMLLVLETRVLLQLLVGLSIVLTVWFLVALGRPWRSESPTTAWLLAAWAWVTAAFEVLLELVLFRITFPLWVATVILMAQDAVFAWRLVKLRQTRAADALPVPPSHTTTQEDQRGSTSPYP